MDEVDPDLAAAMGFSSFGDQNPTKKRKHYNVSKDAVVAAPPKTTKQPASSSQQPSTSTTHSHQQTNKSQAMDAEPSSRPQGIDYDPSDLSAWRNGVELENGDIAYFMPSFIEDPWKALR